MVSILVDNAGPVDPSRTPRVAGSFLTGWRGPVVGPSILGSGLVGPYPSHVTATWVVTLKFGGRVGR